jgi:hypothetical protein
MDVPSQACRQPFLGDRIGLKWAALPRNAGGELYQNGYSDGRLMSLGINAICTPYGKVFSSNRAGYTSGHAIDTLFQVSRQASHCISPVARP